MHVVIAHIPSYVIHDLKPRGRFLMCISELKKKALNGHLSENGGSKKQVSNLFNLVSTF